MLGPRRRDQIVEWVERHGVIRIGEVVRQYGVSRKTALRDLDLLDAEGLVDKVHGGAVAVVGVVSRPNHSTAPDVADRARRRVRILLPSRGHHNRAVLHGVESTLAEHGIDLEVVTTGWVPPTELTPHLRAAVEAGVDALLIRPSPDTTAHPSGAHDWLAGLSVPTVLVEDELLDDEQLPVWSVAVDDARGVAAAIGHLSGLGHHRIGLLTVSDAPRSRELQRFWRATLETRGLDTDVPLIDGADVQGWPLPDPTVLDSILATLGASQVSAVICHNDVPAQALVDHAEQTGVRVPHDLAVVAYEDRLAARSATPITAVVLPGHEVGRVAAEAIVELLRPDSTGHARQIRIAPELVVRQTTSPQ